MAELADAPDLGSGGNTRAGSSPVIRIGQIAENLLNKGSQLFCFSKRGKKGANYEKGVWKEIFHSTLTMQKKGRTMGSVWLMQWGILGFVLGCAPEWRKINEPEPTGMYLG